MKRGTYTKTIVIPAEDIAFFRKMAKERGWKEQGIKDAIANLLSSPKTNQSLSMEEINAEVKAYRYGNRL